jgi:hypothetical protein
MPSLDTSLVVLAQRAIDTIIDSIAMEGVEVLTRVLDEEFAGENHVTDYNVIAHVKDGEIWFEVELSLEALDKESQAMAGVSTEEPPIGARTFGKTSFGTIGRLLSYKDARRDARKRAVNALQTVLKPPQHLHDTTKGARLRSLQHEVARVMPRSLRVDTRARRVSLRLKSMVHERMDGGDTFTYPKDKFEGAIKQFLDRLIPVISKKFAKELEQIMVKRMTG